MGSTLKPLPARERLLNTADQLFYREGIRAVGIDRVIAEAGVAKMTLYAHFKSKDELILAVLQRREQTEMEFFRSETQRHAKKEKSKLRAFFATLKDWMQRPEFRGCAFINATVELADPHHPVTVYARGQRERFNRMVYELLTDSLKNQKNAAELLPAILLLVEGTIVTAQLTGDPGCADTAWKAAQKLIS